LTKSFDALAKKLQDTTAAAQLVKLNTQYEATVAHIFEDYSEKIGKKLRAKRQRDIFVKTFKRLQKSAISASSVFQTAAEKQDTVDITSIDALVNGAKKSILFLIGKSYKGDVLAKNIDKIVAVLRQNVTDEEHELAHAILTDFSEESHDLPDNLDKLKGALLKECERGSRNDVKRLFKSLVDELAAAEAKSVGFFNDFFKLQLDTKVNAIRDAAAELKKNLCGGKFGGKHGKDDKGRKGDKKDSRPAEKRRFNDDRRDDEDRHDGRRGDRKGDRHGDHKWKKTTTTTTPKPTTTTTTTRKPKHHPKKHESNESKRPHGKIFFKKHFSADFEESDDE